MEILPRDGATYVHERDGIRLCGQAARVWNVIRDCRWHTLTSIAEATGDGEASVSARLRDFRKDRFGRYTIQRRHVEDGLFEYRLAPPIPPGTNGTLALQ